MLHAVSANFAFNIIFSFLAFIDSMIYSLVSLLSGLLISLSEIRLSDSLIADFSSRIFVILGILMLFKLTMSLINVVVNPEALTDKQEGTGKIVSRIVIMLIMLLSVNWVFSFAMQAQGGIVRTIPKLLLGTNDTLDGYTASEIENGDYKNSSTEQIAALSLKAFIAPNDNCPDSPYIPYWEEAETISAVTDLATAVCSNDQSLYVFDYNFGISTIVGIFLVFVLVGFCVDIAVRVIKLAILQMLAPIPIISYADPKSSKKSFDNWIKMCISAYIELFLKLAVIYFAIYLLGQLTTSTAFVTADGDPISGWLFILLVIGIFFFAKQAPQYIADIFGVKLDSGVSFFGKLAGMAAAGFGAFGGAVLGAGLGGLGGLTQGLMRGGGLKAAAAGGLSGALAGGLEGTKGLGAGAHQFRNQSNEMARALTGDPKIETGIRGAVKGFVKSSSNANLIRAQQKYDLNWQRKSAEQQRKAGYTSHVMGFHNNGKSLETNITHPNGMKVKLNDGDSYIAFESKSGEFEKFNVEASAVGKVLGTTDVSVIERAMTNQDSRYYNEEFAKLVSKRDKYSARLNAQEARNQAKADKDFNKRLATMLEERGYKKEK